MSLGHGGALDTERCRLAAIRCDVLPPCKRRPLPQSAGVALPTCTKAQYVYPSRTSRPPTPTTGTDRRPSYHVGHGPTAVIPRRLSYRDGRALVDGRLLEETVLRLVVLVDLPLHVVCDELHEQLVHSVLRFDLYRHRDEEGDEEEDAARQRDDLLGGQVDLLARKLVDLALVGEEAHDGGDGAHHHDDEHPDEDDVKEDVGPRNVRKPPVVEL